MLQTIVDIFIEQTYHQHHGIMADNEVPQHTIYYTTIHLARKALTCISEEVIRRPMEQLTPPDISTLHGGPNRKIGRLKILQTLLWFSDVLWIYFGSFCHTKLSNLGCYTVLRCSHGCTRPWDVLGWWHHTTGIRAIVLFETGRPYTPWTSNTTRRKKPPLLFQDDPTMKHGQSSGKLLPRKPCASYAAPYAPKCMCLPRGMWPTSHGPWSLWCQRCWENEPTPVWLGTTSSPQVLEFQEKKKQEMAAIVMMNNR